MVFGKVEGRGLLIGFLILIVISFSSSPSALGVGITMRMKRKREKHHGASVTLMRKKRAFFPPTNGGYGTLTI